MEKAKTRSRAKAVPSVAPTELDQPMVMPQPPAIEAATPPKKTRKTKKKKVQTPNVEANPTVAETVIESKPNIEEPQPTVEVKKRGKRLKAQEIVAQIEQQEHPEESVVVSMLMEESTKLETPAKKTKKTVGRKGRKKQAEEETVGFKTPAPVVVQEPVAQEEAAPTTPANKKVKKRGRKPAATVTEPAVEETKTVEEPVPAPVVVEMHVESAANRTRTRTRTMNNTEAPTKPSLNTTQDLTHEKQPVVAEQPKTDDKPAEPELKSVTIEETNNVQTEPAPQLSASAKKPKTGGARIVRPKETVVVVKAAENTGDDKVEIEKKVVEIGEFFFKFQ